MARKATASASTGGNIPKGMKPISGGYAKTWNVEDFDTIDGQASEVKVVKLSQKRGGKVEEIERRCVEVKNTRDGERCTVWESAALANLFDALEEQAPCRVYIRFTGYGKAKKGQNAPKLFESAIG